MKNFNNDSKSPQNKSNEIFSARSKDANIIKPNPNKNFVPPPSKPKSNGGIKND